MVWIIRMPKLGQTMESGVIQQWLKKEGDSVSLGEAVVVIESEKCSQEVEAREAGTLRKILLIEGVEIPPGTCMGIVANINEEIPELPSDLQKPSQPARARLPNSPIASQTTDARMRVTPAARKLALEMGLDLSSICGTRPGGVITRGDVEKHLAESEGGKVKDEAR